MQYYQHIIIIGVVVVLVGLLFTYLWPRLLLSAYKRSILGKGGGDGPIPVNTLYVEPQALFADPLHPPASASNLLTTGVNHDTLMTIGWLDLSRGPLVLHVPDMNERYYSVQFTDPSKNTNFAYVGTRATGTRAGEFLITGRGWNGQAVGMQRISSPNNAVLIVGRVLVYSDSDVAAAYELSKQIRLTPLSRWQPGQQHSTPSLCVILLLISSHLQSGCPSQRLYPTNAGVDCSQTLKSL